METDISGLQAIISEVAPHDPFYIFTTRVKTRLWVGLRQALGGRGQTTLRSHAPSLSLQQGQLCSQCGKQACPATGRCCWSGQKSRGKAFIT